MYNADLSSTERLSSEACSGLEPGKWLIPTEENMAAVGFSRSHRSRRGNDFQVARVSSLE